jgi:hypothetical protein
VQHNNGYGGHYTDCYGLGPPFNVSMGTDAANSYGGQAGSVIGTFECCSNGTCAGSPTGTVYTLCKGTDPTGNTGTCTCWNYQGTGTYSSYVGYTYQSSGNCNAIPSDCGCFCATNLANPWN